MADAQRWLSEEIESSPVGNDDVDTQRFGTRSDTGGQGTPPSAPTDHGWAVAFKLNVAITVISAVYNSPSALQAMDSHLKSTEWHPSDIVKAVLTACILVVPSLYATSWMLLHAMIGYPKLMLLIPNLVFVVAWILFWMDARTFIWFCCIVALPALVLRGSINFLASGFKAAAVAVKSTPQITCWALCMMAVRAMWLVVASIAILGSGVPVLFLRGPNGATDPAVDCYHTRLVWFWIWSAAWQFVIMGNIVATTVSSSVASWCSSPNNVEPVWRSFRRVMHSSLGSLCKAAVSDSILALLLTVYNVLPIFCGVASCHKLCVQFTDSLELKFAVFFVSAVWGASRGSSTAFVFFGGLFFFHLSPGSGNTALIVCKWAVVPAIVVVEVVLNATKSVFTLLKQDPEAFGGDHRRRVHDGLYRAWRDMQLVAATAAEEFKARFEETLSDV